MADEATATAKADAKDVTLPDDKQSDAPNDQQTKKGVDRPEPNPEDVILPDDDDGADAGTGDESDDSKDSTTDDSDAGTDTTEPKSPEAAENQKQFYERKLREKDDQIASLENRLDEFVDEATDDSDKRIRRLEANDFISNVRTAQREIDDGWQSSVKKYPILDDSKPDTFRKDLHDSLILQFARDSAITEDVKNDDGSTNKVIVGYRVPFDQFIDEKMALRDDARQEGVKEGQTAEAQMRANADQPGSAKSKVGSSKKDPFEEGFDSVE